MKRNPKKTSKIKAVIWSVTFTALILSASLNYYFLTTVTVIGGYTEEQRTAMTALVEAVQ